MRATPCRAPCRARSESGWHGGSRASRRCTSARHPARPLAPRARARASTRHPPAAWRLPARSRRARARRVPLRRVEHDGALGVRAARPGRRAAFRRARDGGPRAVGGARGGSGRRGRRRWHKRRCRQQQEQAERGGGACGARPSRRLSGRGDCTPPALVRPRARFSVQYEYAKLLMCHTGQRVHRRCPVRTAYVRECPRSTRPGLARERTSHTLRCAGGSEMCVDKRTCRRALAHRPA